MLPTFLVLGAARCGTTSLHYYLAEHPDICMSETKEPNYFLFRHSDGGPQPCIDDPRIITKSVPDRERYERLFTRPATAVGEASPLYLYTRETPTLIREQLPDAKLVAVVREPIERAWSHFVYVHDDLGDRTAAAFAEAVEQELPLPYQPYRTGTHFVRLSAYADQLRRYRDRFPRDRLLVVSYDDLVQQPASTLARICRFLDVDDTFGFDTSVRYNPSSGERSLVARIDRTLRPAYPFLKRALPAAATGRLARGRARVRATQRADAAPPIPTATRQRLTEHFAPDVDWLAREEGIELGSAATG